MGRATDPLKLSPRAIYFLLAWAWDFYDPEDGLWAKAEAVSSPAELLFHALSRQAARILRRGADRAYVEEREYGATIRGRLDVVATFRRDRGRMREAASVHTELSYDCPQNRVLRYCLISAALVPSLDRIVGEECRLVGSAFPARPSGSWAEAVADLGAARLHRNNGDYRLALRFARLILESMRPGAGHEAFADPFTRSILNRVFEAFLRKALARELRGRAVVKSEAMRWSDAFPLLGNRLPRMRTDLTIRSPERCMVIDAKYYEMPFIEHHGKTMLRPGHLYQIYAYAKNSEAKDQLGRPWEAIIVYACAGKRFDLRYELRGIPFRVLGLDLEDKPSGIVDSLISIWSAAAKAIPLQVGYRSDLRLDPKLGEPGGT